MIDVEVEVEVEVEVDVVGEGQRAELDARRNAGQNEGR